jgi:hypothetical protein
MKFKIGSLYKNLYTSKNNAFRVDEIVKQDKNGADMVVTWFTLTDDGKYITMGIDGDYYIAKDKLFHYVEV